MNYCTLITLFCIIITNPGFSQDIKYSVNKTEVNRFRIVLDPGHGGKDSVTRGGGILEKNLVLEVALEINALLKKNGYEVIMTRTGDEYISLPERAGLKGDVFISLHANAVADSIGPSVRSMIKGLEIYTSVAVNDTELLTKNTLLARSFETKFKELKGITIRGVKKKSLAVLDKNPSAAILIELGFLSNEEDLIFFRDKSNHKKLAEAFVKAIKSYQDRVIN